MRDMIGSLISRKMMMDVDREILFSLDKGELIEMLQKSDQERWELLHEIDDCLRLLNAPDSTNDGGRADLREEIKTWLHNHRVEAEIADKQARDWMEQVKTVQWEYARLHTLIFSKECKTPQSMRVPGKGCGYCGICELQEKLKE